VRAVSTVQNDVDVDFSMQPRDGLTAADHAAINIVLPPPVRRRVRGREVAILYDGPCIRDLAPPGVDCGYQFRWTFEWRNGVRCGGAGVGGRRP
jgi:hypothetical protein